MNCFVSSAMRCVVSCVAVVGTFGLLVGFYCCARGRLCSIGACGSLLRVPDSRNVIRLSFSVHSVVCGVAVNVESLLNFYSRIGWQSFS